MNLFTGMTKEQIVSSVLTFVLFNVFVMLVVAALAAFHVASRPRRGRVRTAALWHIVAAFWFMWSIVSTVWAAPAEKSFIDGTTFFRGDRFTKVVVGLVFALIGIACMVVGAVQGGRQKRAMAQEAMFQAGATSS